MTTEPLRIIIKTIKYLLAFQNRPFLLQTFTLKYLILHVRITQSFLSSSVSWFLNLEVLKTQELGLDNMNFEGLFICIIFGGVTRS